MKRKEKIDFIINMLFILLGSVIVLLPIFKVSNLKLILLIIFGVYSFLSIIEFLLTKKEDDYQSLGTCILSLIAFIILLIFKLKEKTLLLIFLIWIGVSSLIKLKKADYYHDRDNSIWIYRIFVLFIFLTSGLLIGLNLYGESNMEILLIGFYFMLNGILESIEPIILYLMRGKNEISK